MSSLCLYLVNILTEVNMSLDKNSIAYALIDAQVDNIQQQQKQDALNYQVHELKVCITDLLAEVEKIEQKIDFIANRGMS